jgi:hypothetical protein
VLLLAIGLWAPPPRADIITLQVKLIKITLSGE